LERLNYKSFCFLQIFLQKIYCCNRIAVAGQYLFSPGSHK